MKDFDPYYQKEILSLASDFVEKNEIELVTNQYSYFDMYVKGAIAFRENIHDRIVRENSDRIERLSAELSTSENFLIEERRRIEKQSEEIRRFRNLAEKAILAMKEYSKQGMIPKSDYANGLLGELTNNDPIKRDK